MTGHDAFGAALMDCLRGKTNHNVFEREDGFISASPLGIYFSDYDQWPPIEQRMMDFVRGRVLDVGCGAGRHALHLQKSGLEVVGIDSSPLAVQVARARGVKHAHPISLDEFAGGRSVDLGTFDSVIMMGHNIGLLHAFTEAREILTALMRMTSLDARIVGTTRIPGTTEDADHLEYLRWNVQRGRMPGQIRCRNRYRKLATAWTEYLFLSQEELRDVAAGTGWTLETTLTGDGGFGGGPSYLAVLRKE